MVILDATQTRTIERLAIDNGKTYKKLMEKAGSSAAKFIKNRFNNRLNNVVILCGNGNNGGDGFVVARKLCEKCDLITVVLTAGEPKTEVANYMFKQILDIPNIIIIEYDDPEFNIAISAADIIVDAIYGIGFRGTIEEKYKELFTLVDESSATKIALDLPSGVQCDEGSVDGICFNADYTVTFSTLKLAQILYPSTDYCGEIIVKDVGIETELIAGISDDITIVDADYVGRHLVKRSKSANKGSIGTLTNICGSYSMAGAAMLAAEASLRSGSGLTKVIIPHSIYNIMASYLPECIYKPQIETKEGTLIASSKDEILKELNISSAALIGCGLSNNYNTREIVQHIVKNSKVPLIVDADGINIISENINILKEAKSEIILTPHPKEMSRLTGLTVAEIQADRLNVAKNFSREYGVTLVLKGANTVVSAPDGEVRVNRTGNPGMATGGSGDVLAGIISSLVSQGYPITESANIGVYVHGLAGDIAANKYSQISMLPSDIIDCLGLVFKQFESDYLK